MSTSTTNARQARMLEEVLKTPGNERCADCRAAAPRWASINLGVFLCVQCASVHRKMGTHHSRVRSVTMDTWTREQVDAMRSIGNTKANAIYNPDEIKNPPPTSTSEFGDRDSELEKFIRRKYEYGSFKARRPADPNPHSAPDQFLTTSTTGASSYSVSASSGSGGTRQHPKPSAATVSPLMPGFENPHVKSNITSGFSHTHVGGGGGGGRKAVKSHVESNWADFLSLDSPKTDQQQQILPVKNSSRPSAVESEPVARPPPLPVKTTSTIAKPAKQPATLPQSQQQPPAVPMASPWPNGRQQSSADQDLYNHQMQVQKQQQQQQLAQLAQQQAQQLAQQQAQQQSLLHAQQQQQQQQQQLQQHSMQQLSFTHNQAPMLNPWSAGQIPMISPLSLPQQTGLAYFSGMSSAVPQQPIASYNTGMNMHNPFPQLQQQHQPFGNSVYGNGMVAQQPNMVTVNPQQHFPQHGAYSSGMMPNAWGNPYSH